MKLTIDPNTLQNFNNHHVATKPDDKTLVFLLPDKMHGNVQFRAANWIEKDVSNYALETLKTLNEALKDKSNLPNHSEIVDVGVKVVEEYESIQQNRSLGEKIKNAFLVLFGVRKSSKSIHKELNKLLDADKVETRIADHRNAGTPQSIKQYSQDQLDKARKKRYDELVGENKAKIDAFRLPEQAAAKKIFLVSLNEQACKDAYERNMAGNIQKGYYDPAVIPNEIELDLGPVDPLPKNITKDNLPQLLNEEVVKYASKLSEHQVRYIQHDVKETMDLYQKVYPDKSLKDVFSFGRDIIRISVYQEIYDKASFSGSDHGSKHIHHNIANAEGLNDNMHGDFTEKDRLMEHLVHIFHDVGYTTGLSGKSFDCSKDHPFIGAAMIDAKREYFEHYLGDRETVDVLRDCVLYHAIASPNLTPEEELVSGMHPNMIRSVTSISDACAVTFDRKTQEFWEQPECLIAISKLRLFLADYPQYASKMTDPSKGEYFGGLLDRTNPLDQLAWKVFKNCTDELNRAVETFDIPEDKKTLFKQAIASQFNAMTTTKTFDQYGGVLTGVSAWETGLEAENGPKYLPQFEMAPSIIYGILHTLYGEDQAQGAFKKLLEEFDGNIADIQGDIQAVAIAQEANIPEELIQSRTRQSGLAKFKVHNHFDHDIGPSAHGLEEHAEEMHDNVQRVANVLKGVYHDASVIRRDQRIRILRELAEFRKQPSENYANITEFTQNVVMRAINVEMENTDTGAAMAAAIATYAEVSRNVDMDHIREVDRNWNALLAPLLAVPFKAKIDGNIKAYVDEMNKLRINLTDVAARRKIEDNLLKAAQEKLTPNEFLALQQTLAPFKGALNSDDYVLGVKRNEQVFNTLETTLRITLTTEGEYAYVVGRDAPPKEELLHNVIAQIA